MNAILALQGLIRELKALGCTVSLDNIPEYHGSLKIIASWVGPNGAHREIGTTYAEIRNEYEFIRGAIQLEEFIRRSQDEDAKCAN